MKYAFLLGGFVGFALTFTLEWLLGNTPTRAFTDASLACLISAYAFRWFWWMVAGAYHQALSAKLQAAREAAATATPASTPSHAKS